MSIPILTDLNLSGNRIINSGSPEGNNDVVNMLYLNTRLSDLNTILGNNIESKYNDAIGYTDEQILSLTNNLPSTIDSTIQTNIIDNLFTTDSTKMLSANMGVTLNNSINNINDEIDHILNAGMNIYAIEPVVVGTYKGKTLNRILYIHTIVDSDVNLTEGYINIDLSGIIPTNVEVPFIKGNYTSQDGTKTRYISYNTPERALSGLFITDYLKASSTVKILIGEDEKSSIIGQQIDLIIEYFENIID